MSDFYMGNELNQESWPPNAPRPSDTPPEGIILTETGTDGRTRKILYRATMGRTLSEVVIAEGDAPKPKAPSLGASIPMQPAMVPFRQDFGGGLLAHGSGGGQPTGSRPFERPPSPVSVPLVSQRPALGQPIAPPPPAPPGPAAPEPPCPTSIEMPDGRVIGPDDSITGKDMCVILRAFADAAGIAAPGQAARGAVTPGQPVPVIGGPGTGVATPVSGVGGGPGGGGGAGANIIGPTGVVPGPGNPGAFIGSGIGGPGPMGQPGPPGPPGPSGVGLVNEFLVKTDGNFSAGPGAFVPVPGTLLSFSVPEAGPVTFLLQAVAGCGDQNTQLGLRIDGVDQPLTMRVIHTFAAGVGDFLIGQHSSFTMVLAAGSHSVEVVLRGASSEPFCPGTGLPFAGSVQANTEMPLVLTVLHKGAIAPAEATVLAVDGVVKTDGDFTDTSGVLVPVPGTSVSFTVTKPGNALFEVSANFAAVDAQFPSVHLGIRIDGVDHELAFTREQQGAGDDHIERIHMSATYFQALAAGSHTVEMLYTSDAAGIFAMTLEANPTRPAVITVVHP